MSEETKPTKYERKAGNWVRGFLFYTQESEAPTRFLFWVALSAIAAATQRQVHISWVYRKWYPNMYVMLVGPTGSRKSTALYFGRDLIHAVGIPISSDALSKEAMVEQMVERNKMKKPPRSALTVTVSEFMTFFATSGLSMIEFLTDVWDCHDKWEYATKKRGTEVVNNIFLNMLGATTPSWISETFTSAFTDHGFTGRTVFVSEDGPRFHKSRPTTTPEMKQMYLWLIQDLAHIATLQGEFKWTDEGAAWFDNWYDNIYPLMKIDYRLKGYLERKPTHLLKVAMLLALSDEDTLELRPEHFETALSLLEDLEPNMIRAFSSVGKNLFAADLERMLEDIRREGGMSDAEVRRRNYHAMDKIKLEEQIEQLKMMKSIAIVMRKGEIWYVPRNAE